MAAATHSISLLFIAFLGGTVLGLVTRHGDIVGLSLAAMLSFTLVILAVWLSERV